MTPKPLPPLSLDLQIPVRIEVVRVRRWYPRRFWRLYSCTQLRLTFDGKILTTPWLSPGDSLILDVGVKS